MNAKMLVTASLALSLLMPAAKGFAETTATSLGTSRVRTAGGTNTVKLSIVNHSSIAAAREISGSIYNRPVTYLYDAVRRDYRGTTTDLRTMLANGYKIEQDLPAELAADANAIAIRPWNAGEAHVLSARVGNSITTRITTQTAALVAKADLLHKKGELTDDAQTYAHSIAGYWNAAASHFTASAQVLTKNKVAVLLDE